MSDTFTLTESTWRTGPLLRFVDGWTKDAPAEWIGAAERRRLRGGVWVRWFARGSIRGFSLQLVGRGLRAVDVRVRLNLLASRTDWQLAFALLRGLREGAGGQVVADDGRVLGERDLAEGRAAEEGLRALGQGARVLAEAFESGRPWVALPNPEYSLIVTPEDLAESDDTLRPGLLLEEALAPRAERYERAEILRPVRASPNTALAVWFLQDALVDAVEHLGITRASEEFARVVPFGTALELLGERAEIVSPDLDRYYLAALDLDESGDRACFGALWEAGVALEEWMTRDALELP